MLFAFLRLIWSYFIVNFRSVIVHLVNLTENYVHFCTFVGLCN